MTVKDVVSKLKVMLSAQQETVVKATFAEAELVDGTKVSTEGELAIGAKLSVVAEDGSLTDAPEGMHELTDGTIVTVGAAGEITEITPVEEEVVTEEVVVEEMEEVSVETEVADEAAPATEELLTGIADLIAPFTEEITVLKEEIVALSARLEAIADEPASKKVNNTFAENAKATKALADTRMDRLVALRKAAIK